MKLMKYMVRMQEVHHGKVIGMSLLRNIYLALKSMSKYLVLPK